MEKKEILSTHFSILNTEIKMIQRRLAQPSHKDNVQTQETVHIFKTVAFKYSYHTHKNQYVIDMLISLIVLIY